MNQLAQGISKFDIFGQTITLKMNQKNYYKTFLGGLISIVLFIIILTFFSSNIKSFFNKENLLATVLTNFEEIPSQSVINDATFLFAIQIDQENFLQRPFFQIEVLQISETRQINGSKIREEQQIQLVPCTLERFTSIFDQYNKNITQAYIDLNLNNFLCFKKNTSYILEGTHSSIQFSYLKISIKKCNSTNICASEDERDAEVKLNGSFKIKLYTVNKILNPYNPSDNYLQTYIDDSFYFNFLPSIISKSATLFLKQFHVESDQSLTPFQQITKEKFYLLDQSEIRERVEFYKEGNVEIASIILRKSPYKTEIFRSYLKIDNLLSNLGGISKFDIFGQTITLKMNQKNYYKTFLGGLISIVLFIIILTFFSSNIKSFFNKENLLATVLTNFEEIPSQSVINDATFLFAIQIDQENFLQRPFFQIEVLQISETRQINGSKIREEQQIQLVPCTLERFTSIFDQYNKNITQAYIDLNLNNFLCFKKNTSYILEGTHSSIQFSYLKISIKKCNSTNICASEDERDAEVKLNGSFKIKLYTVNKILNPYNPSDNYLQTYIDDSFYFNFLPSIISKSATLFLKQFHVESDQSLTPFQQITKEKFYLLDQSEIRERVEFYKEGNVEIASIILRKSPYKTEIFRSYLKIDNLLSNLGGMQQIFFFFLGIILALYNRFQLLIELANKLYEFMLVEKQSKRMHENNLNLVNQLITERQYLDSKNNECDAHVQLLNQSHINQKDNNLKLKFSDQKQVFIQGNRNFKGYVKKTTKLYDDESKKAYLSHINNGLEYFQSQINLLIKRAKPIKLSLQILINYISCQILFRNKPKIILMNKAMNQLSKQIDLFNILTKLNEIDKLKEVLLTSEQQLLFDFTPKPIISLDYKDAKINRSLIEQTSRCDFDIEILKKENKIQVGEIYTKSIHLKADSQLYERIYKAYDKVLNGITVSNQYEQQINKQLINQLGAEVQTIFKLSKLIDFSVSLSRTFRRKGQIFQQEKFEPISP
ncbi:unnamed protein product [Paramecium sonneborni]|uniref:Transmembrane protein n=1 Tax=Paramecium sonneborni TaxID=65129 RepID=A0A8S1N374_9CILI|nr:unnamed protein product [Paramecium sonneborni]